MPVPHRLSSLYAADPDMAREQLTVHLDDHGGNVRATAAELGVREGTVHRWIQRWGLRAWLEQAYPAGDRIAAGRRKIDTMSQNPLA
jgi:transposase